MNMDQAAVWLSASILIMLGFVIVVAGAVVINNIIHRFWKPIRIFTSDSWNLNPPIQYPSQEDPVLTKEQPNK
jgi:hypothetical protein